MQLHILGKEIIRLPKVDSTNNYAKLLLKQNTGKAFKKEGVVIIADWQESGKGQYGNTWHSHASQNLMLSIILFPTFLKASDHFLLCQAISSGICECLKNQVSLPVYIKWPNDILIEKKKVCGILIENNIIEHTISESIVGIGINVNQTIFPEDIPMAVSLKMLSGSDFDRTLLLTDLLKYIEKYYLKLKQGQYDFIKVSYLNQLFQYHTPATYLVRNQMVTGTITGVNYSGQLQLLVNGTLITLNNKEVKFIL
jgi:BirA family biotin operon repressor/biotin-[acetyl-CoA-carboxylase] ligase